MLSSTLPTMLTSAVSTLATFDPSTETITAFSVEMEGPLLTLIWSFSLPIDVVFVRFTWACAMPAGKSRQQSPVVRIVARREGFIGNVSLGLG